MKVLVIEDKHKNKLSAKDTLADHDLTIVDSFDAAIEILSPRYDEDAIRRLTDEKAGFGCTDDLEWEKKFEWRRVADSIRHDFLLPFEFDAVLVDMMMPMSSATLAREAFRYGVEVPYGFILVLKAALAGATHIAMVTDTNHHMGAMSAALDHLGDCYYRDCFKPNFVINGAKVMFVHSPFVSVPVGKKTCWSCKGSKECSVCHGAGKVDSKGELATCHYCKGDKLCPRCEGTGEDDDMEERKDWGTVLRDLLGLPRPKGEDDEED